MSTKSRTIEPETFLRVIAVEAIYKLTEHSKTRGIKLVNNFDPKDTQITNIIELEGPLENNRRIELINRKEDGSYKKIKNIDELNSLLKKLIMLLL